MLALELLLVVALLVGVAVLATGRGGSLSDEPPLEPSSGLPPARRLTAADIPGLRFPVTLRGYRMRDVDDALERARQALADLEAEVARLREQPPSEPDPRPANGVSAAGEPRREER